MGMKKTVKRTSVDNSFDFKILVLSSFLMFAGALAGCAVGDRVEFLNGLVLERQSFVESLFKNMLPVGIAALLGSSGFGVLLLLLLIMALGFAAAGMMAAAAAAFGSWGAAFVHQGWIILMLLPCLVALDICSLCASMEMLKLLISGARPQADIMKLFIRALIAASAAAVLLAVIISR